MIMPYSMKDVITLMWVMDLSKCRGDEIIFTWLPLTPSCPTSLSPIPKTTPSSVRTSKWLAPKAIFLTLQSLKLGCATKLTCPLRPLMFEAEKSFFSTLVRTNKVSFQTCICWIFKPWGTLTAYWLSLYTSLMYMISCVKVSLSLLT